MKLLFIALLSAFLTTSSRVQTPARYDLGTAATAAQIAAVDIDVNPAGAGLPAGKGTAKAGATVYAAKCAMCHGVNGEGLGTFPKLIDPQPRDSFPFGRNVKLTKTIGNYWPYATTLFDYIRRAMPLTAPGSLTNQEVYDLTAYLLAKNEVIKASDVIDARSLPLVKMPARERFVRDDRGGTSVR